MSRIGLKEISLPPKVTVSINEQDVIIEGPKGKLAWTLPQGISLEENDGALSVSRASETRALKALHGTSRSLISNMVEGVSQGFIKQLVIKGVGFRAAVKGQALDLSLGKSHPILHPIPEGLTVTVDQNTQIKVEGIDKQLVGQFAAEVRRYYPPEPFKGKGVSYLGERIRRKAGKSVQ